MASVLGYWDIRGLGQPIRMMLNYAGEDFVDKRYPTGPPPDFSREVWKKEKPTLGLDFPNLPYYKDDKVNISQSWTILRYLARKHKLEASTDEEKLRADLAADQLGDFRSGFTRLCYNPKFEDRKADYLASLPDKLQLFEKFLGDLPWFAGDNLTWADFPIYEMFSAHSILQADCLDAFPKLKAYVQRFEALPQIKKYRESDKFTERPLNSPMAAFK